MYKDVHKRQYKVMDAFSSNFVSAVPSHQNPLLCRTKIPPLLPSSSLSSTTASRQQGKATISAMMLNNPLDHLFNINNLINPPLQPSLDPKRSLSNNFYPVEDELPPTECEVIQGSLPPCLDGAYIRNGPNSQYIPSSHEAYHLFDGDGMLHCIKISQGRATFCSRYIKTYKYTVESTAGSPIVPRFFSSFHGPLAFLARGAISAARVLAGKFHPGNGIGPANTSLAVLGTRLYALYEGDLPYVVRLTSKGDVETLGRHDFDGKLVISMTAHPKKDPETGETFAFRYGPVHPFVTYFYFDANGEKQSDVPIAIAGRPPFMHDFGITKNYAIFVDTQVKMYYMEMILRGESLLHSDPTKVSRIGIIPRYAKDTSQMRWFDVPGFNNIHTINAWEEDDGNTIVMVAPNVLSIEQVLERTELIHCLMEKIRIDIKTGIVSRHPISVRNLEFGVINQGYVGKKNRYVYAAVGDPMPKMTGLAKLDLSKGENQECIVATRIYGSDCYGGEPFFVPRDPENPEADEDDGYVVSYIHDENTGESNFLVMDAKSPNLDIVAVIMLPRRVPSGFHGIFVRESDLCNL